MHCLNLKLLIHLLLIEVIQSQIYIYRNIVQLITFNFPKDFPGSRRCLIKIKSDLVENDFNFIFRYDLRQFYNTSSKVHWMMCSRQGHLKYYI